MEKQKHATYVYCAVRSARRPAPPKSGLPGMAAPRALDAGNGLWLVVADAPLEAYGADAIARGLRDMPWLARCAAAHESVVEHMGRRRTVLPLKLFTLFKSDARALAHFERMRPRIERALERVSGRDEWGVRVLFDERRARRAARESIRAATARGPLSGAGFLELKKRQHAEAKATLSSARAHVDAVLRALSKVADEALERPIVQRDLAARVLLDGVFLVSRKRATRFCNEARRAADDLATRGYDVTLSGPWPPYHFLAETG